MKILEIRALRGPNYWSIRRQKLIVMRLDIGEYEHKPTNKIPQFLERLQQLMPSLQSHRCSYDFEGGFFQRVEEGTWAGHTIEHMALELQTLAGMYTGFGRTRSTQEEGIYLVVFSYVEEQAGRYAGRATLKIFKALAEGMPFEDIRREMAADIQKLREIREKVRFGPSTSSIVDEASQRGIPAIRLNDHSLVQLGYGIHQRRIQATVTERTGHIAVELAGDKYATKKLLKSMGVNVPPGLMLEDESEIADAIEEIGGFPVVIKPLDAHHGLGVTSNLQTLANVKAAFAEARKYKGEIILEKHLAGKDFRALVINNKLVAVAERIPAHVVGDGEKTVQDLIEETNQDPRRGYGHEKTLTRIEVDEHTLRQLDLKGYNLDTVLAPGEVCFLKSTANLSTGGTARDCTDEVHPYNLFLFERIARIIGLDIAGIDVVAPNLTSPVMDSGGGIVELNAAPGFRMHLDPTEGIPRNVAEPVVSMLFPPGAPSRVPIISITGTNGKTTTTRLIAHIMKGIGHNVGFTTTDGTYIGNRLVDIGDNTGPVSAQTILKDPTVTIAVLETARGGILRAGMGFDKCDLGIVLNVTADHLGLKDIHSVEQMARVKAVVPSSVFADGYAILNADDKLVYQMREEIRSQLALFSMDEENPHIQAHTTEGGTACVYENGYISILRGKWKIRIEKVINIPLTFSGRATFMIQNVLAATLAAFVHGLKSEDIRVGLTTFVPSVAQTPGRLNLLEMGKFSLLIDYAHNPDGVEALCRFINKFDNPVKTAVIGAAGDRRDEDIRALGRLTAASFTQVIVREDDDRRGRSPGVAANLLIEGLQSVRPDLAYQTIYSEVDAIRHAIENAQENELVVLMSDNIWRSIEIANQYREQLTPVHVPPPRQAG